MSAPKLISFSKPTPDFNRKFYDLFSQKSMVDVTLSADGQFLEAHKVVLAVASSWFEELFESLKDKHPVIVIKDLTLQQLTHIVEFIYLGAVNIPEDDAGIFKSTLESFRISIDDMENEEENDEECEDETEDGEVEEEPENEEDEMETEQQQEYENSEDFHEKLFELVENDGSKKYEIPDIKIKSEPEWDELLVKEEIVKEEPISQSYTEHKPAPVSKISAKIIQNTPVTVKPSTLKIAQVNHLRPPTHPGTMQKSSIRIRTPASINERVRLNEPVLRTVKIVQKHPGIDGQVLIPSSSSSSSSPNKTNIQELSKRLSKAILIRRVKKSDGSIVSERSPIKIVQGNLRMAGSLPMINRQSVQNDKKHSTPVFKCSHCHKAFSVNKRRNAHEKFCFKNPSRPPSQCPFCPMVLCNPMYISTHIRKVHGIDENGKSIKTSS